MRSTRVFFIRGLSTYGHDNARFSLLDLGPVYRHIQTGLSQRGLDLHPVTGLGSGSLPELTDRAVKYLRENAAWNEPNAKIHLLGHSAGGLVARLVVDRLIKENEQQKIASLLTIASPHKGSSLAQIFTEMPIRHPGSAKWLKAIGYNVEDKKHFFAELTPGSVLQLLPPPPENLNVASIICCAPGDQWCWPLKAARFLDAYRAFDLPSDGVVERESQIFGEVIAEIAIDHLRQVGFFGRKNEFQQMLDAISSFYNRSTNAVC